MTQILLRASDPVTLVGGGPVGPHQLEEALRLAPEAVAADGGGNLALPRGRRFRAVIGDMDSLRDPAALADAGVALHPIAEQDSTDLFAQGPDSVLFVRTVTSKHKPTIKVVAVEDNKTVRALRFPGSSASFTSGVTTTNKKAPTSDQRAFVIEQHDGTTIRRRVIPRGEVVERNTLQDAPDDMAGVEFVIAEYFDANGVYEIELSNDAQQDPT